MSNILYKTCPECGNSLIIMDGINEIICPQCDNNLTYDEKEDMLFVSERVRPIKRFSGRKDEKVDTVLGRTRNHFLYFLFGIATLGIGFIFYLFWVFKDLAHHQTIKEVEKNAEPIIDAGDFFPNFNEIVKTRIYASRYLIIMAVFTIAFDLITAAELKYSSLYYHLKKQSKETAPIKSPHPTIFLVSLITFLITSLVLIITSITAPIYDIQSLTISFYVFAGIAGANLIVLVILGAVWQLSFNTHIIALRKMGYK
ncbi:MAG: hypothetical protein ACFFDW_12070 [Candidatus Thorarchaeota archaeon]